jgi:cardiolipin synthase
MEIIQNITQIVSPVLLGIYIISILVVVVYTVLENRNPVKTISWVLVLILLPVIGFVFFIFLWAKFPQRKIIARKGFVTTSII